MVRKEYEVKLTASKKMLEKIKETPGFLNWSIEKGKEKYLVSHYFDTEKFDLLYSNMAYRTREEDGKNIATLKGNGILKNGIYIRDEFEKILRNSEDVTKFDFLNKHFPQVLEITKETPLKEVLIVDNERHILYLKKDDSLIEVSLDFLHFILGKRKVAYNEIELELKNGCEEDLLECASFLKLNFHLFLAGASKYEMGLRSFNLIPLL
jgi:inorganic triphosphatase YgiF